MDMIIVQNRKKFIIGIMVLGVCRVYGLDKTINTDLDRKQFVINLNNHIYNQAESKALANQSDNFAQTDLSKSAYEKIKQFLDKESLNSLFQEYGSPVFAYKKTLVASAVLIVYGYIFWRLHTLHNRFAQADAWSNWKIVIPLHQLQAQSYDDLINQLVLDIFKKYGLVVSECEAGRYYQHFIEDIKAEMQLLEEYQSLLQYVHGCRLSRFFSAADDLGFLAQKKERLLFIFDICMMHFRNQNKLS